MTLFRFRLGSVLFLAVLGLASVAVPHAARTHVAVLPLSGIGTQLGSIDTRVESVTHSDPILVEIPGVGAAYEMHGVVSGIGWGGDGIVNRARQAHYAYEISYVARWPQHGGSQLLVAYYHGGPPPPVAVLQADRRLGAMNPSRFAERYGDRLASAPTLARKGSYVSFNRRGLRPDGRFGAKYLTTEVDALTETEVENLRAVIAPGDTTYTHPDLVAGAAVPVRIATDSITARDVARALEQVVGLVSGVRFHQRIAVGQSAGSNTLGGLVFGRNVTGPSTSVRTGGNHWIPDDPSSPRIYDGFILNGFPYQRDTQHVDDVEPLAAPVFVLHGRGDERYQDSMALAYELLQKGATLNGSFWVQEIANLPHVPRDNTIEVTAPADNAEPLGPYLGAAIRNMRDFLSEGVTPPPSHVAGRIVNGTLAFDVAGGWTDRIPVREDPALDSIEFGPMLPMRTVDAAMTARWQAVTAVLDHVNEPIVGPSIACRIGAFRLRFAGATLTPFDPAQLSAMYGGYGGYEECVKATVSALNERRLYDSRVEPAKATAARARNFF
jgi:Alpha/beta hydrolase domain